MEESGEPTPDLQLTLRNGLTVTAEITMSTDDVTRRLYGAFDGARWRNAELSGEWWVILSDYRRETRNRDRDVEALIDDLVPVLQDLESQDCEPAELCRRASQEVAGFGWRDWSAIRVAKFDPSGGDAGGGIRTWVVAGDSGRADAVDALTEAIEARIDAKTA